MTAGENPASSAIRHESFLQLVYDRFRQNNAWPLVRDLLVELRTKGNARRIASEIGTAKVVCEESQDGVCFLRLEALAQCKGAEDDVANVLSVIRLTAARYIEVGPRTISSEFIAAKLGLDAPAMERLGQILYRNGGFWGSGSWGAGRFEFTPREEAVFYESVETLEDFFATQARVDNDQRTAALQRHQRGTITTKGSAVGKKTRTQTRSIGGRGSLPLVLVTALGRYKVGGKIGEGGCGQVFKVADESGAVFAVKILDPRKATTEKRKRFANELHFCSRVDHPSIVQVVDYGSARIRNRDAPFYIMPFYKTTLRDLLRQKVRPERALTYFAHILDGVEAAHKKGVVHRDLKPENILHDEAADRLLVADFGIAQFAEEDLFTLVETQPTTRLANFQYAAPEQKVRSGSVTQRSDIYALGLILNELFTGEVAQGTAFRSIGDAVPAMEYLDALVGLMIRQNPQDRPASIEDVKRELIARGNDFVRLQKLNQSKSAVVPQEELDDPFVTDPIRLADIIDYDESEHRVVLQLSKQPSHDWIRIFHNLSGVTFHRGREPQTVQFHGSRAYVLCDEHNAPVQLTFFREWLARANENYARWAREQLAARIQTEKMALREAVAKEEARQRVLNRLRGQT